MCVRLYRFLFIILLFDICRCSGSDPCILNIQRDLNPSKEPLILEPNSSNIVRPHVENKNGIIHVQREKEVILACPGSGNVNTITRRVSSHLGCSKDGKFYFQENPNRTLNLRTDTSCQKTYACSSPKVTDTICGLGSTTEKIIQLGFQVGDIWLPQVEVCFNTAQMFTLYSYHKIYGKSLDGAVKDGSRKGFCVGDRSIFSGVNPSNLFLHQNDILDKILGNGSAQRYIQKDKVYFARGHLAADADFYYNSEQMLTYNYVNMAPQWQSFNNGNWKKLEDIIRRLAVKISETLEVYTGTYGVTTLKDKNNTSQNIFLEATQSRIPVPEVLWKLVRDPGTSNCIVAVGVNNVYLESNPNTLCTPKKPQSMIWGEMEEIKKGYTYYCSYEDFKKAVPYVPGVVCSSNLLQK